MKLLYKSKLGTAADISHFYNTYKKAIGTRESMGTDGTGIYKVNSIIYGPANINLINERPVGSPRGYMPDNEAEFQQYLQETRSLSAKIRFPAGYNNVVTVENEAYISPNINPDMVMIARMLQANYQLWTPRGIKVSTSGTFMYLLAALTDKYYRDKGDEATANAFRKEWAPYPYSPLIDLPLRELKLITDMKLTGLWYAGHMCVTRENINCISYIITAMREYVKPFAGTFFFNEISFESPDAALLKDTLTIMAQYNMPLLVGYNGNGTGGASTWTEEMKAVFASFAV